MGVDGCAGLIGAAAGAEETVGMVGAPGGGATTDLGKGFLHDSSRSAGRGGGGAEVEVGAPFGTAFPAGADAGVELSASFGGA